MKISPNQRLLIIMNISILLVAIVTFTSSYKFIKSNTCYKISQTQQSLMYLKVDKKIGEEYTVSIFQKSQGETSSVKGKMSKTEIKSYEPMACPNQ